MNALKNSFLDAAIEAAKLAQTQGDVPVGAVVVYENKIVATAYNQREAKQDPTAHAEILALRIAAHTLGSWRLNHCDVFVTLEPCAMCAGALVHARVSHLYYGTADPKTGACGSVLSLHHSEPLNHKFGVTNLKDGRCSTLLKEFFASKRV